MIKKENPPLRVLAHSGRAQQGFKEKNSFPSSNCQPAQQTKAEEGIGEVARACRLHELLFDLVPGEYQRQIIPMVFYHHLTVGEALNIVKQGILRGLARGGGEV